EADLNIATNPCDWVYHSFGVTGLSPAQTKAEAADQAAGVTLLPIGHPNHVPFYFDVGLNVTYNFANVLKGLQLYTQISNLLNKTPPSTPIGSATTSNAAFYDELGLAYRVGFRLNF
ncbi:MAG: hypothetical protein ACREUT_15025, partial [Steroidobacteraceae bacterium]